MKGRSVDQIDRQKKRAKKQLYPEKANKSRELDRKRKASPARLTVDTTRLTQLTSHGSSDPMLAHIRLLDEKLLMEEPPRQTRNVRGNGACFLLAGNLVRQVLAPTV